jgi:hypothetical protein
MSTHPYIRLNGIIATQSANAICPTSQSLSLTPIIAAIVIDVSTYGIFLNIIPFFILLCNS